MTSSRSNQFPIRPMLSDISIICFAACYAIAFALELVGLKHRFVGRRIALIAMTLIGLVAHAVYLTDQATIHQTIPLASPADWLLVFAWVLAATYLAATFYLPHAATGLLILPLVLSLIAASQVASREPFAGPFERTFFFWGMAHGLVLLFGITIVCVGCLAGLMYLVQSYSLKHAQAPFGGLKLPSLERLERINSRALGVSTVLVAVGFASGVAMSILTHRGDSASNLWTEPVIVSSAAMLLWLVAAEIFRLVYPAARRGRKVAYLTLASFVFVVMTVVSLMFFDSGHGGM